MGKIVGKNVFFSFFTCIPSRSNTSGQHETQTLLLKSPKAVQQTKKVDLFLEIQNASQKNNLFAIHQTTGETLCT